ncbi:MAG: cytochrome c-type biogenesis protein CcmH [Acidobacteria bacterium]|nr:cytochrome c-type biogenesis protein CcmH [Acidobacteriota bacterium]
MKATTRFLAAALVSVLALAMIDVAWHPAYAQQTERAKTLGKKLMCMCGCSQILTACNHVGCSTSTAMLKKLDLVVARNEPDDLTLQSFVQEYGLSVLAEPPAKGFNRVAWFIPIVAFALGLGIVLVVISHWRRRVALAPAGPSIPPEMLERVRRQADQETED